MRCIWVLVDTLQSVVLLAERLAGPQAPGGILLPGEHLATTMQHVAALFAVAVSIRSLQSNLKI